MRLYLVASKPTDSVIRGILPAAAKLGLDVVLLTDKTTEHVRAGADATSIRILHCDVWDARQLICAIAALPVPDAIFSNSDHLQTQTALAAAYFGVPGKDWRSAMRAKNKSLMRRRLDETGVEHVAATEIRPETSHPLRGLRYPVVLKPSEGVASEDVMLVGGPDELRQRCERIFARRPGETLLAEEYLAGGLRTMETLGDGVTTWVLGGFRTQLSPLPFFIEERLTWDTPVPDAPREHVLGALAKLGAGFGACHTEYVGTERGPVLIEVNDRLIGDHCDFVLSDLLGVDLFELVLRVYLGEPLPPGPPPQPGAGSAHAVIDYVVADRPGVLAASPAVGAQRSGELGVVLSYRPVHEVGDRIPLTNTNRDYLGVITAIGADPGAVEVSVAAMRATGNWEITECPS